MTLTDFLVSLADSLAWSDPRLAERIRTAACISLQLEENERIARRDRFLAAKNKRFAGKFPPVDDGTKLLREMNS